MNEQLISVLRRPDGLFAIVSSRRGPFTPPGAKGSQQPDANPYCNEVRPFADVRSGKSGPLARLAQSWESLASVRRLDAHVLYHVLNVLVHTLPDAPPTTDAPPLKIEIPPAPARPTAAHPRAYCGTKTQPPKPRRSAPIDLRPHLCVPRDTNQILRLLAPHLDEARSKLQAADILVPDRLRSLIDGDGRAVDVYLSYCHQAGHFSLHALPSGFRRSMLFWLRGRPWDAVGRALALYYSLDMESDSALLYSISRLLALSPVPTALDWCEILRQLPAQRRLALAELMIETGICWRELPQEVAEKILCVHGETADAYFRHRMFVLLRSIVQGGDLAYLMVGFHLANRYWEAYDFQEVASSAMVFVSPADLERLAEHLDPKGRPENWSNASLVVTLWECLPEQTGYVSRCRFRVHKMGHRRDAPLGPYPAGRHARLSHPRRARPSPPGFDGRRGRVHS
jgi:hypothetical protein